ncbi:hypothetical protein A2473_00935 [candidate division WWE3 bacterium RIFOXYC2_FULL_42_13]|uniref:ComEC/Rec2-related protein domain-containing protein n=1 Tax=candidate division WWE3 bacterium TaxID=2053526 RepID=A0A3D0ZQK1_UNCKA|nr:MAG: hypothetical protein A2245_03640 [candidate division WWE3 bacterium RIFOXYA2_FULL_43_12]OGC72642.1 MAG: hypothetical protein A2473_00935 [candidate division WWE3 bacterium RIFOXYC2_FULL_42_13]HCC42555.1 hypothetical protein [candidate division WWE3 bacterium]
MRLIKRNLGFIFLMLIAAGRVVNFCVPQGGIFSCTKSPEKGPFEFFEPIKQHLSERARKFLPSPHSELVLGMTIGVDDLSKSPRFKDAIKRTGTIHVVVVSGFNMSLVAGYALKIFGSPYKVRNLLLSIITTFSYAAFTGFEPPVLRAWVMSSFMLVGKFSGRLLNSLRLLVVSYFGVLLINPGNFFSASTYLSFLATFGLIVFADPVESFLLKVLKHKWSVMGDFSASFAAQIMVWPLISGMFGQVSLISLLVNALVLWTVPITTVLGIPALLIPGKLVWMVLFPFCDFFIRTVNFFSGFNNASVAWKMPMPVFIVYYAVFLILTIFIVRAKEKHK